MMTTKRDDRTPTCLRASAIGVSVLSALLSASSTVRANSPSVSSGYDHVSLVEDNAVSARGAAVSGNCCDAAAPLAHRSLAMELSMMFDTSDFPPRWRCGTWSRPLGLLHIISDIAIFASYVAIPAMLVFFVRKRVDAPFSKIFWLFGAFIIFCGVTHLMEAIIFYWPAYRIAGVLKFCTAVVSLLTSVALIRVIPRALQFKSPTELQQFVNQQTLELRQANEDLGSANRDLRDATEAAELANHSKSKFLANMSHEIRTPMTAILGFTELLSDLGHGDAAAQQAIETVQRNGKHLLSVVNDILDLSKIEAGHLKIEPIPTSPVQLIHDACMLHDGQASSKGIVLRHDVSDRFPTGAILDSTRLKQILSNLITNAIKFTDSGTICVRAQTQSSNGVEFLRIDVIDTGIGMTAVQQERIFKPFAQADNSTTRRFGGTGLGLTISRSLAELMGGSLNLVRSEVGAGSVFRLSIPLVTCDFESPNPEADATRRAPDYTAGSAHGKTALSGYKVLVADDGVDNQKLFAILLRNAGAEVTVVENGLDAVKSALSAVSALTPFDVVLMDMQMPVMDGYDATRRLRNADYRGAIVALTAHAMTGDREACLTAGCDDYLSKPAQRTDLINMILKHAQHESVVI